METEEYHFKNNEAWKWIRYNHPQKKGNYILALEVDGVPNRAFVLVDEESNFVIALRKDGTKIAEL